MEVIKTSVGAYVHHICAELTKREVQGFRGRSVAAFLAAPVALVASRVVAVAAHAFWTLTQTILVLPDIIGLTALLGTSSQAGLTVSFCKRATHVYGLYFKAVAAQFALGTLACVIPEITHYKLELHKSLFSLQLEAFIQTLPDFPHISKAVRKNSGSIESLALLAMRLNISDDEWKRALITKIKAEYSNTPGDGYKYLFTESDVFQKIFKKTICELATEKLNQLHAAGTLHQNIITGISPVVWITLQDDLNMGTKVRLVELLKHDISDLEVNRFFLDFFKHVTGCTYRSLRTTAVLKNLLEHMKLARQELIDKKSFTADEIADQWGASYDAVTQLGLLLFFKAATIEGDEITFGTTTLSKGYHFYGKKDEFIKVKRWLDAVKGEYESLYQHIIGNSNANLSPNAMLAYHVFGDFKAAVISMNNDGLEKKCEISWGDAF